MSRIVDFDNPVIDQLFWPSRLYDADGKDITGRSFKFDLDTGDVWSRELNPNDNATGHLVTHEKHKAPLTMKHRDSGSVLVGRKC